MPWKYLGEQHSEGQKNSTCKRVCLRNFKEAKWSATEWERGKTGKEVRKVGSSAHTGPYRRMNFGKNEMGSHWKILSIKGTQFTLYFRRISLMWWTDYKKQAWMQADQLLCYYNCPDRIRLEWSQWSWRKVAEFWTCSKGRAGNTPNEWEESWWKRSQT